MVIMKKVNISLDFEYLENLNKTEPERYWKFVDSYNKYFQKKITLAEKDYLKKKGIKEIKTFEEHQKMQNALNRRKELVKIRNDLLRLNFMPFNTIKF